MFVFNCTKAAADFFSVTRKGKKVSFLEPAPHKTIAESIGSPVFPDDIAKEDIPSIQWHWVVHSVSIKRKKYLVIMDYLNRFCITMPTGKKGDEYDFLNNFDLMLRTTYECLATESGIDEIEIQACIDGFDNLVNTCAFHARSDRSVQGHINDVVWHLERQCYEDAMLTEVEQFISFNLFTGQLIRNIKEREDYIFPSPEFLSFWSEQFLQKNQTQGQLAEVINFSDYKKI